MRSSSPVPGTPLLRGAGVFAVVAILGGDLLGAAPPAEPVKAPPRPGTLTPAQIAEHTLPSVVLIRTADSIGSGFIVSPDGRVATNLHVIAGATQAMVVLHDGREFKDVEVAGADPKHDLVILRVPSKDLPALRLGDSAGVRAGDHVVAIGHPLGLGNTVSDGLVSAVRVLDPTLTLLQISAPIAPGSSGGPLLNDAGEVVAVATLASTKGQNLNFGLPVSYLRPLMVDAPGKSLAVFAREQSARREPVASFRSVPKHDLKVLEGCAPADIQRTATAIGSAISVGAPLYNEGNHEACFRIYQGTALDLDRRLRGCRGVKQALDAGVNRADGQPGYTEKAWSMRDAFDGLLNAIERKLKPE